MTKKGFFTKQLIEILKIQYQEDDKGLSEFENIIYNENLAFKMIQFISQIETIAPNEDLDYRKRIIQGSCAFALELLSENPSINLYEQFLKKISKSDKKKLKL